MERKQEREKGERKRISLIWKTFNGVDGQMKGDREMRV